MMDIRPIRNDDDLAWALAEVESYVISEPAPGTPDGDRFDVLVQLIEAYEAKHHAIEPLDPVSFLRAHMENTGRTQADLARVLGSASRASEILNRKRNLTLEMIRALVVAWNVPGDALLPRYPLIDVA
jgi:HTH-type transcriptional regulator/antitoxin HigA